MKKTFIFSFFAISGTIVILFQNCSSHYKADQGTVRIESQASNAPGGPYPSTLLGTVYYFSDCGDGADLNCISNVGDDANSGTDVTHPFKTSFKFQQIFNEAKPGDQILFAQCGSWTSMQTALYNNFSSEDDIKLNLMKDNPVIIGSYRPSWCSSGARPILQGTAVAADVVMNFTAGGSGKINGGFIIRDLLFQGAGYYNNEAMNFFRWPHHVLVDNVVINNFGGAGITCGGQPSYGYPGQIIIRNSFITNNGKLGLGSFGCNDLLIENNKFDNNGFDDGILSSQPINQNHQLYVSGTDANDGSVSTGITIRANSFTNSSVKDGRCQSAVIVGHDVASDWLVEKNLILQANGTNSGGCWGISFSPANGGYIEGMDRLTIRGNTLINVGNNGIHLAACRDCLIENNVLIWTSADDGGVDAIRFHHAVTTPSYIGTQLMVRNNSIYFNQSADISRGIVLNDDGSNHSIVSNLIYFGSGLNIAANCFETNLPTSSFRAWDNNSCFHFTNWSTSQSTLNFWQSSTGFDLNSITTDPILVEIPTESKPSSLSIQVTSPAKDKGHTTLSAASDVNLCLRDSFPDIGAYENTNGMCK